MREKNYFCYKNFGLYMYNQMGDFHVLILVIGNQYLFLLTYKSHYLSEKNIEKISKVG